MVPQSWVPRVSQPCEKSVPPRLEGSIVRVDAIPDVLPGPRRTGRLQLREHLIHFVDVVGLDSDFESILPGFTRDGRRRFRLEVVRVEG